MISEGTEAANQSGRKKDQLHQEPHHRFREQLDVFTDQHKSSDPTRPRPIRLSNKDGEDEGAGRKKTILKKKMKAG